MTVMSIDQYVMCGDILREIVEADIAAFGENGADVEALYELYIGQVKACGIPFEETADNIYDVPAQFAEWVSEIRESL